MGKGKTLFCILTIFLFLTMPLASAESTLTQPSQPITNKLASEQTKGLRAEQATWSIMIYIDGDNNLESAAIDDINELETLADSDDVNFIVQLDTRHESGVQRYDIAHDDDPSEISSTPVEELEELDMADPATLTDFITWSTSNYPAENYMLVLWNHGAGWKRAETYRSATAGPKPLAPNEIIPWADKSYKGILSDDTDGSLMSMAELHTALENAATDFKIIGFDACLMQMLEVAYEVKDYTEIVVGSEEVEPWDGWPYDTAFADLVETPSTTPEALASDIVEEYVISYEDDWSGVTMSAIATSALADLASEVDELADVLSENIDQHRDDYIQAMEMAESFYYSDFIDLYDFAEILTTDAEGEYLPAEIVSAAEDVMAAVDTAVIAEDHLDYHEDAHGVSIYAAIIDHNSEYNELAFSVDTEWNDFLQDLLLPDDYENDDTIEKAVPLALDTTQEHTFHVDGDEDWLAFEAENGTAYIIETLDTDYGVDTTLTLYDYVYNEEEEEYEPVELAFNDDYNWLDSRITWLCNQSGTYYIEVDQYPFSGLGTYSIQLSSTDPFVDLAAWMEWSVDAVQGQPNQVTAAIYNLGIETAENFSVSLYAGEEDFEEEINYALIDTIIVESLAGEEYTELAFEWTPEELGYYALYVEIEYEEDTNLENNIDDSWAYVAPNAPHVQARLAGADLLDSPFVDEPAIIELELFNRGGLDANDTVVDVYEVEWDEDTWEEIETLLTIEPIDIGSLEAGDSVIAEFEHTFTTPGTHLLKAVANCTDNYEVNDDYNDIYVAPTGPDVYIGFTIIDWRGEEEAEPTPGEPGGGAGPSVNDLFDVNLELFSLGQEDAENTIVTLNDSVWVQDSNTGDWMWLTIQTQEYAAGHIDSRASKEILLEWQPTVIGHHKLDITATCDNEAYTDENTRYTYRTIMPPAWDSPDDLDEDGVADNEDNCIFVQNPAQLDDDENGIGNACEGDFDNDGLIDANDNVVGQLPTNLNLNLAINGSSNLSQTFAGNQQIEITDASDSTILIFEHNFDTEALILHTVSIQTNSIGAAAGYTIVSGIDLQPDVTKTVYVARIQGSNQLVVKDADISAVSEITDSGTGADETLLTCNGVETNGLTCTIEGAYYKVTGLTHSGIKELDAPSPPTPPPDNNNNNNGGSGSGGGSNNDNNEKEEPELTPDAPTEPTKTTEPTETEEPSGGLITGLATGMGKASKYALSASLAAAIIVTLGLLIHLRSTRQLKKKENKKKKPSER